MGNRVLRSRNTGANDPPRTIENKSMHKSVILIFTVKSNRGPRISRVQLKRSARRFIIISRPASGADRVFRRFATSRSRIFSTERPEHNI